MPRTCIVCNHLNKLDINREIVQGKSLRKISLNYDVPYQALYSHAKNHLSRQLVQAFNKKELDHSTDLLERIDTIVDRCEKIFTRSYDKGKDITALKALGEQRQTFELIAKISYALHEAKRLEQSQTREQIIQELQEQQAQGLEEQLEVLTKEEKDLYFKLNLKMISKNSALKVVPDSDNIFTQPTPERPLRRTKPPLKQQIEIIDEPIPEPKPEHPLRVRPVNNATEILVTSRRDDPDDPTYQLRMERTRWRESKLKHPVPKDAKEIPH